MKVLDWKLASGLAIFIPFNLLQSVSNSMTHRRPQTNANMRCMTFLNFADSFLFCHNVVLEQKECLAIQKVCSVQFKAI